MDAEVKSARREVKGNGSRMTGVGPVGSSWVSAPPWLACAQTHASY
jgi:hypothetical protein